MLSTGTKQECMITPFQKMISLTLDTESYIVESSSSQVSCNVVRLIMPRQFNWVGKASKILPKVIGAGKST